MLAPILSVWFLVATMLYLLLDRRMEEQSDSAIAIYMIATSPLGFLQPYCQLLGELIAVGYMQSTGNGPPQVDPRTHDFCMTMTTLLLPSLSTMAGVLCWMLG